MQTINSRTQPQAGSALVMVAFLMTAIAGAALVMLVTVGSSGRERAASQVKVESIYAAEAALSIAVLDISTGGTGVSGANGAEHFGGAAYSVGVNDMGGGLSALTATASIGNVESVVEAVVEKTATSVWTYGAFGDESLTLDSNAHVDSYDSSLGTYASQEVNGNGNSTYALDGGNVGSNLDINLSSNSTVHGSATPGPSSTTTVTGNAVVSGSTTPAPATVAMPPLVAPAIPFSGSVTVSGGSTAVLPSGDHGLNNLTIKANATLMVKGPATLYVGNAELRSNAEFIVDATNGPVTLYVVDDFILSSNTLMASLTFTPSDLQVQLESDNIIDPNLVVDLDDVTLDSNAQLYGSIYAPNALIDIDSNFELFGAVVARKLHLDSNSKIHYDESLADSSSSSSSTLSVVYSRVVR